MLTECKNLTKLHLSTAVAVKTTPTNAAKAFHGEAFCFLEAFGAQRNKKDAALDILKFGSSEACFSVKDGDDVRKWTDTEKSEFVEILRGKLK